MSTILKALRRLEDERASTTKKTLHDEVVAPGGGGLGGGRRPAWLFAVLGMGAGVVVTVLLASYFSAGRGAQEAPAVTELAANPQASLRVAPSAPVVARANPSAVVGAESPRLRFVAAEPSVANRAPAPPVAAAPNPRGAEVARPSVGVPEVAVIERPPATPTFVASAVDERVRTAPPRGSVPPSAGIAAVRGLKAEPVTRTRRIVQARASAIPKKRYPSRSKPDRSPPAIPPLASDAVDSSLPPEMSGGIPGPTPAFLAAEERWDEGVEVAAIVDSPSDDPWAAEARPALPEPIVRAPAKAAPASTSVPDVAVVRTIWHPQADRRTAEVRLDGSNETLLLREGDALGPLLLVAIEPSGIVLHHEGEEMRRRIGR